MNILSDTEQWQDIPEYEGLYQASNLGRIKCLEKCRKVGRTQNTRSYVEKVMRLRKLPKKKYLYVSFCKNGITKSFTVHRLIAKVFIPNPDNLPEVNHIDGNPLNNAASNLEWTTRKGNAVHAYKNGLLTNAFGNLGIKNPSQKRVLDPVTGMEYESIVKAAKSFGITAKSLGRQLRGEIKNKTRLKLAS